MSMSTKSRRPRRDIVSKNERRAARRGTLGIGRRPRFESLEPRLVLASLADFVLDGTPGNSPPEGGGGGFPAFYREAAVPNGTTATVEAATTLVRENDDLVYLANTVDASLLPSLDRVDAPLLQLYSRSLRHEFTSLEEQSLGGSPYTSQFSHDGDRPHVQAFVVDVASAEPALRALGMDVTAVRDTPNWQVVAGFLPVDAVAAASTVEGMKSIQASSRPELRAQGAAANQWETVSRADQLQRILPQASGCCFEIGVMSDSFNQVGGGIAASVASGDLPADFPTRPRTTLLDDGPANSTDEGRAMAELIFDVAPGVDFLFHSASNSPSDMADGLEELQEEGAVITVDDIGWFNEPWFQDGQIAEQVDENYLDHGVLHFSAAGNDNNQSWFGAWTDGDGDGIHEFSGGDEALTFTFPAANPLAMPPFVPSTTFFLQWNQEWGSADTDIDIEIWDATLTNKVADSDQNNNPIFGGDPYESVTISNNTTMAATFNVVFRYDDGDAPAGLTLMMLDRGGMNYVDPYTQNQPAVYGHPAARNAFAIGAADVATINTIENFSSLGPATIFRAANGDALLAPDVRQKPDFVAGDNVDTTFFGGDTDFNGLPNFSGTSAAAPNAAAVAALIRDLLPITLDRPRLHTLFRDTAVGPGAGGWDNTWGWGTIDPLAAGIITNGIEPRDFDITLNPFGDANEVIGPYTDNDMHSFRFWSDADQGYTDILVIPNPASQLAGADPAFGLWNLSNGGFKKLDYDGDINGDGIPDGDGFSPRINRPLTEGDLHSIQVFSEVDVTGNSYTYILQIDAPTPEHIPITLDFNGEAAVAGSIVRNGFIDNDVDWYRVVAPSSAAGTLNLLLSASPQLDATMRLYNDAGSWIGSDFTPDPGGVASIQYNSIFPGRTYYVRVASQRDSSDGSGETVGDFQLDVDFELLPGTISGTVYEQTAASAAAGAVPRDTGLFDWDVYLDMNDSGNYEAGGVADADSESAGTILNNEFFQLTLTTISSDPFVSSNVRAAPSITPGSTTPHVFAHENGVFWTSDTRRLRVDFDRQPVTEVSIDYVGPQANGANRGLLEAYDANDNLLATYVTRSLGSGQVETMTIRRDTAEIAYAIAGSRFGDQGLLDNLRWEIDYLTTTDADGRYEFDEVPSGVYDVRVRPAFSTMLLTEPTSGVRRASVASGGASSDNDFRFAWPTSVQGRVIDDANGDGIYDSSTEGGLSNWTVFVDADHDRFIDHNIVLFSATDVPVSAPFAPTSKSELEIQGLIGHVLDANVILSATTNVEFLTFYLHSPSGTRVRLTPLNGFGLSGNNFFNTTFNDEASLDLAAGSAPYMGFFRPDQALSAFDGENPNGTWRVELLNRSSSNAAQLNDWSLRIEVGDPTTTTDSDGNYSFDHLPPGTHVVDVARRADWKQTAPFSLLGASSFRFTIPGIVGQIVVPPQTFGFGSLYSVDPTTGAAFAQRASGVDGIAGVAFAPDGRLFALTTAEAVNAQPSSLYQIDLITGTETLIGPLLGPLVFGTNPSPAPTGGGPFGNVSTVSLQRLAANVFEGDIEFDASLGVLYGLFHIGSSPNDRGLMLIDPDTGSTSFIGSLPTLGDPSAMAFDDAGTLYVLDTAYQQLWTIDKSNAGVLSTVNLSQDLGSTAGMDFDPVTGTLYVVDGGARGTDTFYQLDPTTGVLTPIGPLGTLAGLRGLEFIPGRPTNSPHAALLYSDDDQFGLDFLYDQITTGTISGLKFDDLNANGIHDTGEPGLSGWTIYADLNSNGIFDAPGDVEPDDYVLVEPMNAAAPGVTLSVVGVDALGPDVVARENTTSAPTGSYVFARPQGTSNLAWGSTSPFDVRLRADFDEPVSTVSIDMTASHNGALGLLEAYDTFGNLVATYEAGPVDAGIVETMSIVRSQAEIAFVLASGRLGHGVLLDNLLFGAEPFAVSDASGFFAIPGMETGRPYTLREVPQSGWSLVGRQRFRFGTTGGLTQFGNARYGTIGGSKFNDLDGDGVRDAGEPGVSGWTVFLDTNFNRSVDQTTREVVSTRTPLPIPDAVGSRPGVLRTATNVYSTSGLLTDIDVTLSISHAFDTDLDAFLISPSGTRVELFTDVGGGGDHFVDTTLDDEASTAIVTQSAPFSGTFRPEGLLSDFVGENPNGHWVLEINDDRAGDAGVLESWSLSITRGDLATTTDANGDYSFDRVPAGHYRVFEEQRPDWVQTSPLSPPAFEVGARLPVGNVAPIDPRGVVLGPNGEIFVASHGDDSIIRFNELSPFGTEVIFDSAAAASLDGPTYMAFGPDGLLYVSSYENDSVLRFDVAAESFVDAFVASGAGGLNGPQGLAFDSAGNLLVASELTNEILAFDAAGTPLGARVAAGAGGLAQPHGIAEGFDGRLYLSSLLGDEVLRFDLASGAFVDVFADAASGLDEPSALAFGDDGRLYVASSATDQILRYNTFNGDSLGVFAEPRTTIQQGRVPGDIDGDNQVNLADATGLLQSLFGGVAFPCGDGTALDPANVTLMDFDGDGAITLDDQNAIVDYSQNGGPSHVLGTQPVVIAGCAGTTSVTVISGPDVPLGLAFGEVGGLYVGSAATDEVIRFAFYRGGSHTTTVGSGGAVSGIDFGNHEFGGAVEGFAWHDVDGDGVRAAGEAALAGITVRAFDLGADGIAGTNDEVQVAATITAADGTYTLQLGPRGHTLAFDLPSGASFSPANQGGDDSLDSDVLRTTGQTSVVAVTIGGTVSDVAAGMILPDQFGGTNNTMGTAVDTGAGPGIDLPGQTISQSGVDDWYRFEMIKPDDVDVAITFTHAFGDLALEVTDAAGTVIASSDTQTDDESVTLNALAAGVYFVRVYGVGGAVNVYNLSIRPAATSLTRIFYVNDASTAGDVYATAAGNDANDGLSPSMPKASVQAVLDAYVLGPNDLVKIDTGVYAQNVVLTAADEGACYVGSPGGSHFTTGTYRWELIDADFNLIHGLRFSGPLSGTGIYAHVAAGSPPANNVFQRNTFTGTGTAIRIDDGEANEIRDNVVSGPGQYGFEVRSGASVLIVGNTVSQRSYAVWSQAGETTIENNDLAAAIDAVLINGAVDSLVVSGNRLHGATDGLDISGGVAASVFHNEIFDNTNGVRSNSLAANVYGNEIHNNATGISGFGTFGGVDWSVGQANDIHHNATGAFADNGSTVRFNRIHHNTVGVEVEDTVSVHHNVLYRNTGPTGVAAGILVDDGNGVTIVNNTIYTPQGDGVHVRGFSENTTLRNNIVWTGDGYDLRVAPDSQIGFASDYNNLYATGAGELVFWQKPFVDLFDWQAEADFDNHSIGRTSLAPTLDDPLFVNLAADDYRLTDQASTSIDAGAPADSFGAEPVARGPRINLGAYGGTSLAAQSASASIAIDAPNYYTDLQDDVGQVVLWHTFDDATADDLLAGDVDIDLYEEGVGKVADIAVVAASDGSLGWTPSAVGIAGDIARRYRIRITSVAQPALFVESREPFSIVPDGAEFFVDDDSNFNDEYTPTATGDNRNTGQSADDPKSVLLALLRSYDLGPGDTVRIDAGKYVHVRNTRISGAVGIGDDEGATYTGPTDVTRVAAIDRGNPHPGSTNIELFDADFVTLTNLTFVGAYDGLVVRGGSTNFSGADLTVFENTNDGIVIESDAEFTSIARLTAYDNGDDGVSILTPIASLTDSLAYDNGDVGFLLTNQSSVVVTGSEAYGNNVGISLSSDTGGAPSVIGDASLAVGLGNRVHDNRSRGIDVTGNVLVVGNAAWGHSGSGDVGIRINTGGEARHNVAFGNYYGIETYVGGLIAENRAFDNSAAGLHVDSVATARGNVVYSNGIGILGEVVVTSSWRGLIEKNIVYANALHGIVLRGVGSAVERPRAYNNTVYQRAGDALRIEGTSTNVDVRNNVLWTEAGAALSVAGASQLGFTSDYNLLRATGAGVVGNWQGVARASLAAWKNAGFTDENSIDQDPRFADPLGGDGVLGFDAGSGIDFGDDDDFHVMSQHGRTTGSLAPVLGASGLPEFLPTATATDAMQSPAIDRGDATFSFALEPTPNGGFINLGGYGDTSHASLSPAEYVLVTRADGGEVWPADQSFAIRWRSDVFAPTTVDIELRRDGDPAFAHSIAAGEANDGEFSWYIDPAAVPPNADYRVVVTRTDNASLTDESNGTFEITPPIAAYYVNDASLVDDEIMGPLGIAMAVGDDANDGLHPSRPKASIRSVLETYDLDGGDVVYVNTGVYNLSVNLLITADDAGVAIIGPSLAGHAAVLDRGNTATGSYVVELVDADDVTLDHLTLVGGQYGAFASATSDSDNVAISNSEVRGNSFDGIHLAASNDGATINGNDVHRNVRDGIDVAGSGATISDNAAHDNGDSSAGIRATGAGSLVSGNRVYANFYGIYADASAESPAGGVVVDGNVAFDNLTYGIWAANSTWTTGNEVYGHDGASDYGIYFSGSRAGLVTGNVVYGNETGIAHANNRGVVEFNRVFDNAGTGIAAGSLSVVRRNDVYDNDVGIHGRAIAFSSYRALIENNVVYDNATYGVRISTATTSAGDFARVWNNTVYQRTGDAIRIDANSHDVDVRNNIFRVDGGTALSIAADSQVDFRSDYNLFQLDGGAVLADWGGVPIGSRVDWFYELGYDGHSQVADPRFEDVDGIDGNLGYDRTAVPTATIIDDGDAGFATVGAWTTNASALARDGDDRTAAAGTGTAEATWTFSGLTAGATYRVARTWRTFAANASNAEYELIDGGIVVGKPRVASFSSPGPNDFTDAGSSWEHLATVTMTGTTLVVRLTDEANGSVIADAMRLERIGGDFGADDDFHLRDDSPGVDGGDPASYYLSEPNAPTLAVNATFNGGRVNVGGYGNTDEATSSPLDVVQVLSPNGFEKFEVGQSVDVSWRAAGLGTTHWMALVNVGGETEDNWLYDRYQTVGSVNGTIAAAIDPGAVADPPPEAVYQRYAQAAFGVGNQLTYLLPVADGTYDVTLHFAEPSATVVGNRRFDIGVQGVTPPGGANFDILAAAGAVRRAVTVSANGVVAVGGSGVLVELTNVTGAQAVLAGIEISTANPGVADPTVDLDLLIGGAAVAPAIAVDQTMDRYGRGSTVWTASPTTTGNTAQIRATADPLSQPTDVSDESFLIAGAGTSYYVNVAGDADPSDNEYTTAAGDNANDGKSASTPMASLRGLLAAYDLDAGDTVFVDTGTYALLGNVVIDAQDAGVAIQGPLDPFGLGHEAVLDRANVSAGSYAIELVDADGVSLRNLTLTGGEYGIFADAASDSDGLVIAESRIRGHARDGVFLGASNDDATIEASEVFDNVNDGIDVGGMRTTVRGNTSHDNGDNFNAIIVRGAASRVLSNTVYATGDGIEASISSADPADRIAVADNTAFNNLRAGIVASNAVDVFDNEVHGHTAFNGVGILLSGSATSASASGNDVHHNRVGIQHSNIRGVVEGNRVYANAEVGIDADVLSVVRENTVFGNSIGILGRPITFGGGFRGRIENNLVYANSNQGIVIRGAGTSGGEFARAINNTVYQTAGDAVRVEGNSRDVRLRNNILWVEDGFAIRVDADSQQGFDSDFNLLRATGSAEIANWGGRAFGDLVDWRLTLGYDANSLETDPALVDLAGPDTKVGYRVDELSAATIIDDGDAGFATTGVWTVVANAASFGGDELTAPTGTGAATASWTFGGLTSGATYELAVTWRPFAANSNNAEFTIFDDATVVAKPRVGSFLSAPNDFVDAGADWERLATATIAGTTLTVVLSDAANGSGVVADAVRLVRIDGDHSADDDFHVQSGAAGIDAGDVATYHLAEPTPNGGRVNIGRYGNTGEATLSPVELVQVLSPNGYEKFEEGESVDVRWRSSGLAQEELVARINAGGETNADWLFEHYRTAGATNGSSISQSVDTSSVADPAPESVYQDYALASLGAGNTLIFDLPAADGTYDVLLHFAEPSATTTGSRMFDVDVNGDVVTGFDIFAAAGAVRRAVTLAFASVQASGGSGIVVRLTNLTLSAAVISGIEITRRNPSVVADALVDVELLLGGIATAPPIATGVVVGNNPATTADRFGRGRLVWTAGPQTAGNDAQIRVTANTVAQPTDDSNAPFLITNAGNLYYVNDGSLVGDEYATAVGNNANSGKTPDAPLADLPALLRFFDLDLGDFVRVDTGAYTLLENATIRADDAGAWFTGPTDPTGAGHEAVLDRANTTADSVVFDLFDADGVLFTDLTMTGGQHGIRALDGSDSDGATIAGNRIFGHDRYGIHLTVGSDDAVIDGNVVRDNGWDEIYVLGDGALIRNNEVYESDDTDIGIRTSGRAVRVQGNTVSGHATGIDVAQHSSEASDQSVVEGNTVFDNATRGIFVSGAGTLALGNEVYGHHSASSGQGIFVSAGAAMDNVVRDNRIGLYAVASATVEGNRALDNDDVGINAGVTTTIRGNYAYSNSVGIRGEPLQTSSYRALIENNLVYANTNHGIVIRNATTAGGVHARVINNTVFQEVGDAVRIENNSRDVELRGNILDVGAGHALFVAAGSQTGLSSDFNLYHQGVDPNAHVAFLAGATHDTLAAWLAATGQDANSQEADPQFVDPDGADNVLGFRTIGGTFDGGPDDNFALAALSPAIDRADSFAAPPVDIEGFSRVDDPGSANAGGQQYVAADLGASLFAEVGTPLNLRSDDSSTNYNFPGGFSFPFYGALHTSVRITSNGLLQFDGAADATDGSNSAVKLIARTRIAPLWDDLTTQPAGRNVYSDATTPGQITIRWDAENKADGSDVRFSVTLFDTGRVQFHYGAGNANLSPTVGISQGGRNFLLAAYDGQASLDQANSIEFDLAPGVADVGAYEFRGSSFDTTPPTVVGVTPPQIAAGGVVGGINQITVALSEPINSIDANAAANFELRDDGGDGVFDNANDRVYTLIRGFAIGGTSITLIVASGALADGEYRLTISPTDSLRDQAGIPLDGDEDGTAGGAYVRSFTVSTTIRGDFDLDGDVDDADIDLLLAEVIAGTNNAAFDLTGDGTVDQADAVEHVTVILGTQFGDVNLDGVVNRTDAATLANNYGWTGGPAWARGNLNGDANIDLVDAAILQLHLAPPPSPSAAASNETSMRAARSVVAATRPDDGESVRRIDGAGRDAAAVARHRRDTATRGRVAERKVEHELTILSVDQALAVHSERWTRRERRLGR